MPALRSLTRLGAAAALCLAAACGGAGDPTSPSTHTEPRWDMDITVRYVRASSDATCDGTDIFGNNNPGEYQYDITASAKSNSIIKSLSTAGYGTVTGTSHVLDTGQTDNFANQTWSFTNLSAGEGVLLAMAVTEWDGLDKDSYMNNRSDGVELVPSTLRPAGGSMVNETLDVGNTKCGLSLVYDLNVVQRQVQVGN
jgi:hypothetical protein